MAIDLEKLNIVIEGQADSAVSALDKLIDRLNAVKGSMGQFATTAKTFATNSKEISSSLQNTTKVESSVVAATEEVAKSSESTSTAIKDLGRAAHNSSGHFSKLLTTIKRVATMRLIRWAIRQVVNAAKEGIEILVKWDETFGNNTSHAAQTVQELSDKWREVKKSIGAALMPLIQVLQPVLNGAMNLVIGIANIFNQIIRSAQGFGDYMKATYINTSKTASAAKEIRRQLFGFDELNVLNGNGGTGSAGSVSPIEFDPTAIESKWSEIGEKLKQTWASVVDSVKTTLGGLWDVIKGKFQVILGLLTGDWEATWDGLKTYLMGWANVIVGIFKGTIDLGRQLLEPVYLFVANKVFKPIGEAFKSLGKTIATEVKELWGGIVNAFNTVVKTITDKWNSIKTAISNVWNNASAGAQAFLATCRLVVDAIKKKFTDAWEGFKALLSKGGEWFEGIKSGIGTLFKTLINGLIKGINAIISVPFNALNSILTKIKEAEILGIQPFKNLIKTVNVPQIPLLASGGVMPNKGNLFIAGEQGAEVVANMGSSTGVMNVKQMQDAVSNGNVQVVNAVGAIGNMIVAAINNKDMNAYLDGQMITDNVLRRANGMARATGQPVLVR